LRIGALLFKSKQNSQTKTGKQAVSNRAKEHQLFSAMTDMFAACEIIYFDMELTYDACGKPADGVFCKVNSATERLLGKSREQLIGRSRKELFGNVFDELPEKFDIVIKTGKPDHFQGYGAALCKYYDIYAWKIAEHQVSVILRDISESKRAEEALRNSETLLTAITDNSSNAIYVKDLQSRWLFANPALEKIVGRPSTEVLGKTDCEIYGNNEASNEIMNNDLRIMDSGKPGTFDESVEYPDGRHYFISVKAPRFDDKGHVIGLVGISHDITERKKTEEALKASEKKANDLIKYAPSGIYEIDYRNPPKFRSVNDAMCQILGYTREELLALSPFTLLVDESRVRFQERMMKMLSGEKVDETVEFKIIAKDGREVYAVLNITFTYKDGKSDGALVIAHDVTERKKAELALLEWAQNLEIIVTERTKELEFISLYTRSLIEASLDPLVTISVEGKITDVNKATENVTGCTREELIGSDFSNFFNEPDKARAGYLKVFTDGYVKDYPLSIKHKSGSLTDVLYNASIYKNSQSEIQGVFAAARDITERKRVEQKLKDTERLANIGATAGMVGHDIRNPLQAIIGDIYLAKDQLASIPESSEKNGVKESLEEIEKNIDYINKIVQDLQDYSRPLNPQGENTDLDSIITNLFKKNGVPKNIKTLISIEDSVKKIKSDSYYIHRIMYNLVTNAIQAMPVGGKLTINAYKEANDLVLKVNDTGVGIPEEVKGKLFTPMFTTKAKGQGFGLPVVKRMTESLGGTVTFESQKGKGTTFAIRLPLKT
jgi:PAS domain S-box-containing protein